MEDSIEVWEEKGRQGHEENDIPQPCFRSANQIKPGMLRNPPHTVLRTRIPSPNQQNLEFRAGELGSARPNVCCAGEQDAKRRPARSCGSTNEAKSESRIELTMSIDFGTEDHEFSTVYRRELCYFQEA
jgi:hypothetical protein